MRSVGECAWIDHGKSSQDAVWLIGEKKNGREIDGANEKKQAYTGAVP